MNQQPFVILLAAGENSRFFPLNTGTHKGGRTIAGKSLINRCIDDLIKHGFDRIRVVVSEKDFGGKGLSSSTQQGVEYMLQAQPNGQADAIIKACHDISGDCIVASPYYISAGALAHQLVQKKQQSQADCVVLASSTDQPGLYGMLELEGDSLKSITEKSDLAPTSNVKINSFYLFSQNFLQTLAQTELTHYSLESSLSDYAQDNLVKILQTDEPLPSLKFAWHLLDFCDVILSHQVPQVDPSASIASTAIIDESKGPVVIAAGADIRHYAVICGPAYIGENVLIGEYSFVRGSAIEANTKVGANTEIVRSLLLPNVTIHSSYCADSVLGEHTTVGAGLITANLRLDGNPVQATVSDKKRATGKRKMGVITGDNVHLGVRVTSMPGTLIGSDSTVYPNLTISHTVESNIVKKI